ncbi:phosphotransferase-like protein [Streptomyces sp. NRRL F-6628]|uniref:phosphotransferase-like protein n=1 Tax=Streptomyces sp. NRRL F-6628 TaxID=1463876 RepID=UPI003B63B80B
MPASEPGPGEARGRIVFLNGTSSAGKSSIAGELHRAVPGMAATGTTSSWPPF